MGCGIARFGRKGPKNHLNFVPLEVLGNKLWDQNFQVCLFFGPSDRTSYTTPPLARPAQLAELSRSKFDPELISQSPYVKFLVTFETKLRYLTFCDKV